MVCINVWQCNVIEQIELSERQRWRRLSANCWLSIDKKWNEIKRTVCTFEVCLSLKVFFSQFAYVRMVEACVMRNSHKFICYQLHHDQGYFTICSRSLSSIKVHLFSTLKSEIDFWLFERRLCALTSGLDKWNVQPTRIVEIPLCYSFVSLYVCMLFWENSATYSI